MYSFSYAHGMSAQEEPTPVADLSNLEVKSKYMSAANITNKALKTAIAACVDGVDIAELCMMGDGVMLNETGKLYNKKKGGDDDKKDDKKVKTIKKGVAFPTCISVNETFAHFSPIKGESKVSKTGDLVKIDMACHIDGFIAAAAHTVLIGEDKVDDRRADVTYCAWTAAEAALRLALVGNTNKQVTAEAFGKASAVFNCRPMNGVKSHRLKKNVIDNEICIESTENIEDKVEPIEFQQNEVYCIDVVMSTGEGKDSVAEIRSTIFRLNAEVSYIGKTQKARQFISEVSERFPSLPFSLRHIEDEQVARVGVSEAMRHGLLEKYPVWKEQNDPFVVQFKFTVLLLPGGTNKNY